MNLHPRFKKYREKNVGSLGHFNNFDKFLRNLE